MKSFLAIVALTMSASVGHAVPMDLCDFVLADEGASVTVRGVVIDTGPDYTEIAKEPDSFVCATYVYATDANCRKGGQATATGVVVFGLEGNEIDEAQITCN